MTADSSKGYISTSTIYSCSTAEQIEFDLAAGASIYCGGSVARAVSVLYGTLFADQGPGEGDRPAVAPVLRRPQNQKKKFEHFSLNIIEPGFGENHPQTRRAAIQSSFCLRSPY